MEVFSGLYVCVVGGSAEAFFIAVRFCTAPERAAMLLVEIVVVPQLFAVRSRAEQNPPEP